MLERIDPEHRDEAEDVIDRLWRGDLPSDYVLPWVASDGRRIRIRWRFSHLADYDGAVTILKVASTTESLLAKMMTPDVIDIPMLELEAVGA